MRWILIFCFLLASARDIITSTTLHPRRDLWPLKSVISSKLFGTDTVPIQMPDVPKNEEYQLFKIKGYDNVILKVNWKPKEKDIEKLIKIKYDDPVVNPEMAVIGNYLGTATQRDTLLALEIVKNLLKSGTLGSEREKTVQKVVLPLVSQDSYKNYIIREPVEVITGEKAPIYIRRRDSPIVEAETFNVVNRRPIAVYPAEYPPIGSGVKYRPLHTNFFYKQETEDTDMVYESHNNREVIVTKTNKVPVKPHYISLRLADIISIAANPSMIRSRQPVWTTTMSGERCKEILKVVPIHSYIMEKNAQSAPSTPCPKVDEQGYDYPLNLNGYQSSFAIYPSKLSEASNVPNFIKHSSLPFDIRDHLADTEIEKLNNFINAKLDNKNYDVITPKPFDKNESDGGINEDQRRVDTDDQINPGKIISRYSYKQLGDEGHDTITVRIEDPKLNQTKVSEIQPGDALSQNYVYVPPTDTYIPPPMPNANTLNAYISPPMPNVRKINHYIPLATPNTNIKTNFPASIPNTNNIDVESKTHRYDNNEGQSHDSENFPRTSLIADRKQSGVAAKKSGQLKTNVQHSMTKNPIVVPELDNKSSKASRYNGAIRTTSRKPFTGAQRTNKTSKTSSLRYTGTYTGGPVVKK